MNNKGDNLLDIFLARIHEDVLENQYENGVPMGKVTDRGISTHFLSYLRPVMNKLEKENREHRNRVFWNSAQNIIGVFKRMKNEEPLFLIPKEDLKFSKEFIERLCHPPETFEPWIKYDPWTGYFH